MGPSRYPASQARAAHSPSSSHWSKRNKMNKPLALIIEDEFDLSEIYSKALQGGGFETEIIRDGKAALSRLTGNPPALVILDLHLPHVEGADILQHIRANDAFKGTSVIITTA